MMKKLFIGFLTFILLFTGCFAVFKIGGNRKFEKGNSGSFDSEDIADDIIYLLGEPLTLTNKIITDEQINSYKLSDEVYIINNPKRLNFKVSRKIKKIVFIKTENEKIAVVYYRDRQEVRIK